MNAEKRHRVVVLGAGFAGLKVAKKLCRDSRVEVVVIDKRSAHTYHPLLYEVASGFLHKRGPIGESSLARGVSFSYDIILRRLGCGFVRGEVTRVDLSRRVVITDGSEEHTFDSLVVALGSETDFFGIPRLSERALTLKTLKDALHIRKTILEFLDRKKRGKDVVLRVMVGGGGATGVETAAEIANTFRGLQREHDIHSGDWSVRLVEASPRVLSMLPKHLSDHALHRLEKMGVRVMLDTCIKRVEDHHVILSPRQLRKGEKLEELLCDFRSESEKAFDVEVLVWCGGVRASKPLELIGLPLDRKGRLVVDETLVVSGANRIYAAGDCAALTNPDTGRTVPALAQSAMEMAGLLAENIQRSLDGSELRTFTFHDYPTIIPLGGKSAVAHLGKWHLWGFPGYVIRQVVHLKYYLSILSFRKALSVWIRGGFTYIQND